MPSQLVLFLLLPLLSPGLRAATAPPEPPRIPLYYAVWVSDFVQVDGMGQSFTANFTVMLRWDPNLAPENWAPQLQIPNETRFVVRHPLPRQFDAASNVNYRETIAGTFFQSVDLRDFPFDRADFRVSLVIPGAVADRVELVPDKNWQEKGFIDGVSHSRTLTVQDWRVLSITAQPAPYVMGWDHQLQSLDITFTATRKSQYFLIKVVAPLTLIVMMSWVVFWLEPLESGPKISVTVTSMLTLIAYRFAIESNVPKLPYLTRLDTFILAATILIFLSLIQVVTSSKLAKSGRPELARKIDLQCRWIFPCTFLLAGIGTLFSFNL